MNHTGTGEVEETEAVEETAAPLPETFHRVDETGHYHGEGEEGP